MTRIVCISNMLYWSKMAVLVHVNSSECEAPLLYLSSYLNTFVTAFPVQMLQLQLSSLCNHASERRGIRAISDGKVWPSRTWGVQCKMCSAPTHTLEGNPTVCGCVFTDTQTHTYMPHDWGLWVTKVRMRRSDERKSENVRSIDIEHEPTTEGLACVGGPHVCAALAFDRSGASVSAPQLLKRGLVLSFNQRSSSVHGKSGCNPHLHRKRTKQRIQTLRNDSMATQTTFTLYEPPTDPHDLHNQYFLFYLP